MFKITLGFLLIFALIFSCGEKHDFKEEYDGPNSPRDRGYEEGSYRGSLQECEGTGYSIYAYGDCENFRDMSAASLAPATDSLSEQPVDILFVIDSSRSMFSFLQYEEIQKKFGGFLHNIKNLNWRIFFTNALVSKRGFNGKAFNLQNNMGEMNRQHLDAQTANYKDVFLQTLATDNRRRCFLSPKCTGRHEQPLKALRSSFLLNQDITRKTADFVAVIITNSDESKMDGMTAEELVESVIEEFEAVYGQDKRFFVFSLLVQPGEEGEESSSCKEEQRSRQGWFKEAEFGVTISQMAKQTGGGNFSICLPNFSVLLAKAIVRVTAE